MDVFVLVSGKTISRGVVSVNVAGTSKFGSDLCTLVTESFDVPSSEDLVAAIFSFLTGDPHSSVPEISAAKGLFLFYFPAEMLIE